MCRGTRNGLLLGAFELCFLEQTSLIKRKFLNWIIINLKRIYFRHMSNMLDSLRGGRILFGKRL